MASPAAPVDGLRGLESGSKDGVFPETARVVDHAAERRLCLAFDVRILPVLAVMCESASVRGCRCRRCRADAVVG